MCVYTVYLYICLYVYLYILFKPYISLTSTLLFTTQEDCNQNNLSSHVLNSVCVHFPQSLPLTEQRRLTE